MASKVPSAQISTTHRARIARQNGTTLMGFLLGIGFSLIVTALVAYFVYSAGSPFKTEKNANPPTASLPAPKPIEPPKEPPKAVAKSEPVASPVVPAVAAPAPVAATPAPVKSAPAPAEKAPEKTAEKALPAKPSDESKPLFLQAGAFNNKSEAEARRAQLALVGLEAKITEVMKDEKPIFRVRIGPFDSPESASRARGEMARNGIDSVLLK